MEKKTRCYIYTRVSTAIQVDGYSLDAQKDKLRKYAEFHILGDNGNYYKTTSNGTTGEFKVFAKYRFPTKNPYPICRFYISAQYSIRTGIGATIGIDI